MKFSPHKVIQLLPNECVRCSVASLLCLNREAVPNFMDNGSWHLPLIAWLRERGLEVDVIDASLPVATEFYLGQGDRNGTGHCVVMRNGQIWHDPSGFGIDKFETWLVIR